VLGVIVADILDAEVRFADAPLTTKTKADQLDAGLSVRGLRSVLLLVEPLEQLNRLLERLDGPTGARSA
jgi:hypothetical protein